MSDQRETPHMGDNKFISFKIDDQAFCVDIMAVREIRCWARPTPIPHSPNYVCGIINLRGTVLPIIDLGARLGMATTKPMDSTVTIVCQIADQMIGLMVDGVSDILSLNDSVLLPTPDIATETSKRFFKGVASLEGGMIRVIDLSTLVPATIASVAA